MQPPKNAHQAAGLQVARVTDLVGRGLERAAMHRDVRGDVARQVVRHLRLQRVRHAHRRIGLAQLQRGEHGQWHERARNERH